MYYILLGGFLMSTPKELRYTKEHEWVKIEDGKATIGITDFAQSELGDIVFVELPEVGDEIAKDQPFGSVESVKTVSELYAPVSGTVVAINEELSDNPEYVNESPYGTAWMITVELSVEAEVEDLMDADAYAELIEQ
jgi:glycine cleavage system H protein